ncbi:hypothetical protein SCUP515_06934 [Seiridium cupressi]
MPRQKKRKARKAPVRDRDSKRIAPAKSLVRKTKLPASRSNNQSDTRNGNSGEAAAREFHYFSELPMEIQLMIWDEWRKEEPPIRHYLLLGVNGRFYGALNPQTHRYIPTTARTALTDESDPLDPMEYKIRFTNHVGTVPGTSPNPYPFDDSSDDWSYTYHETPRLRRVYPPLSDFWRNRSYALHEVPSPGRAWVNFKRDVFFVDNVDYRRPGRMRFLHHNIGAWMPKELDSDHWAFRIEKLAFYTDHDRWDELDYRVFSKMDKLRSVFIVTRCICPCWLAMRERVEDTDEYGFISHQEYDEMRRHHGHGNHYARCYGLTFDKDTKHMKEVLVKHCKEGALKSKSSLILFTFYRVQCYATLLEGLRGSVWRGSTVQKLRSQPKVARQPRDFYIEANITRLEWTILQPSS